MSDKQNEFEEEIEINDDKVEETIQEDTLHKEDSENINHEYEYTQDTQDSNNSFNETNYNSYDKLEDVSSSVNVKKKTLLMPCTIISLAIFLIALLSGIIFLVFFNVNLVGSYVLVTEGQPADTPKTYLIIEDNGVAKISSESTTYTGKYFITPDNIFSVNIQNGNGQGGFQGDFNYKLTNKGITERTLSISYQENPPLVFNSVNEIPDPIKPVKDFKVNKKFIGSWSYKDDTYVYTSKYQFNDDCTMNYIVNTADMNMVVTLNYSVKKDTFDKTYYAGGKKQTLSSQYSFDKDILIIDGVGYTKE